MTHFSDLSIDDKITDLEDRCMQFQALRLPGQPFGMHMGTSYLVRDLMDTVKELRSEIEELHSK
jgi:hypothetical protein